MRKCGSLKAAAGVCSALTLSLGAGQALAENPPPYVLKWGTYGTALGQFRTPKGLDVDANGNVFVTQLDAPCRVQKFSGTGSVISAFGGCGTGNSQFDYSWGCEVDGQGNFYVVDTRNDRVQKFSSTGSYLLQFGTYGSGNGQFNLPYGVAVDAQNNVYVTDRDNSRVQKFTSSGVFLAKWGSSGAGNGQFNKPLGIAVDPSGNVYVGDAGNNRVQKFSPSGVYLSQLNNPGAGDGQLNIPGDLTFDAAGNLYLVDAGNHRVQKFTSNFQFITKFGSLGTGDGQLYNPWGIAVDSNNYVFVADSGNHRVLKFGPSGGGGGGQGNTPPGNNVLVSLDPNAVLLYGHVVTQGNTTLTTTSTGPAMFPGLRLVPSNPPKYYDIRTTAVFDGPIEVTINYNPADVTGSEAALMMYHYDTSITPASWREITTSVQTGPNKIVGVVESLSLFVLVEPAAQTGIEDGLAAGIPQLLPAVPNPFRAGTEIRFVLPEPGPARVEVFDLEGRSVRLLRDDSEISAGEHVIRWDGTGSGGVRGAPGVYFIRLTTRRGPTSQKILMID